MLYLVFFDFLVPLVDFFEVDALAFLVALAFLLAVAFLPVPDEADCEDDFEGFEFESAAKATVVEPKARGTATRRAMSFFFMPQPFSVVSGCPQVEVTG